MTLLSSIDPGSAARALPGAAPEPAASPQGPAGPGQPRPFVIALDPTAAAELTGAPAATHLGAETAAAAGTGTGPEADTAPALPDVLARLLMPSAATGAPARTPLPVATGTDADADPEASADLSADLAAVDMTAAGLATTLPDPIATANGATPLTDAAQATEPPPQAGIGPGPSALETDLPEAVTPGPSPAIEATPWTAPVAPPTTAATDETAPGASDPDKAGASPRIGEGRDSAKPAADPGAARMPQGPEALATSFPKSLDTSEMLRAGLPLAGAGAAVESLPFPVPIAVSISLSPATLPALTAGPAASAPLIPTARADWPFDLATELAATASLRSLANGTMMEIRLDPETLGRVTLRLEVTEGTAHVAIVTQTPEAARLFTDNQHRLAEALARAGLDLGQHSAGTGSQTSQQGRDRPADPPVLAGAPRPDPTAQDPAPGARPQARRIDLIA